MARLARLSVAGHLHHVIQRGNNGQAIFCSAVDYQTWLDLLLETSKKFDVAIHAYVLMENHFHLLVSPGSDGALPQMMQAIGRRYVRYFNTACQRSGTLWEGRYRATVLQVEQYLLPCMAYIDLNPVRAGLVDNPLHYPWSSHAHYLGQATQKIITPHALFWTTGNTPFAREEAYANLVREGLSSKQLHALTDATLKGWALGDAEFLAELQKKTPRRLKKSRAGRPADAGKASPVT